MINSVMKYQIFHTEKNHSRGLPYGHPGETDTRVEGAVGGYDSRDDAERVLAQWQAAARRDGHSNYADALHVERIEPPGTDVALYRTA